MVATLVDFHDNIMLNRSQGLRWNKIVPFAAFCQLYSYLVTMKRTFQA